MNYVLYGLIGVVTSLVTVPIAVRVFQRLYPVASVSATGTSDDDRAAETALREFNVATAIGSAAFAALWWGCMMGVHARRSHPEAIVQFKYGSLAFVVPAAALGLATATLVAEAIFRRRLGPRYEALVQARSRRGRMDVRKSGPIVYSMAIIVGVFLTLLVDDDYAYFYSTGIVVDDLGSFHERQYLYSDVQEIKTAPVYVRRNGRVVRRRHYVLKFRDGTSWSTIDAPSTPSLSMRQRVATLVSSNCGCPVTEVDRLEGSDL
jgi:hypothetical protein